MVLPELKILHLDDDALYLEQFAATLSRAPLGVTVRTQSVDNVPEYLQALGQCPPDVAVLDVNVSGTLCGQEVARQTKMLSPQTLVFMCSDLKGIKLVAACLSAGADDFIFKGTDEQELALRIYGIWKLRSGGQRNAPQLPGVVGRTMAAVAGRIGRIVTSAVTAVHVCGESGTGKELVSDLLAAALPKGTPFVRLNCGAIAPSLLESELFGHVRGAFTGAAQDKIGLLEKADGGWIFFDEVATLPTAAQIALLRALETHTIRKVGGTSEKKIKFRVLSATNEDIGKLIESGAFRGDLWQRLCEATIELPPLRERMDEFVELARYFAREMANGPYELAASTLEMLSAYDWRGGNVRELRNCLRAMTELAVGKLLTPLAVPKWFWEKVETNFETIESQTVSTNVSDERISRLAWSARTPPTFEHLTNLLLLEIVRQEAFAHGKVSIRHLARVTSIPKSTLSSKLRHLIDQDLISTADLSRMVNIARE